MLQKLLYEDAMMHLCRLTDPPETFGRANLSVRRLADSIADATLKTHVSTAASQLHNDCEFARIWRNRRLAHTDLPTLRNGHASTLPSVTSAQIEGAVTPRIESRA